VGERQRFISFSTTLTIYDDYPRDTRIIQIISPMDYLRSRFRPLHRTDIYLVSFAKRCCGFQRGQLLRAESVSKYRKFVSQDAHARIACTRFYLWQISLYYNCKYISFKHEHWYHWKIFAYNMHIINGWPLREKGYTI
jgi:hypothetical protein